MAAPTRYYCKYHKQELKIVRVHRGFQKFQTPDGKTHQCLVYNGRTTHKCNSLEIGVAPV